MRYRYRAYTLSRGVQEGTIEAADTSEATKAVAELGYRPLNLQPDRRLFDPGRSLSSLSQVNPDDVVQWVQDMATLLHSGGNLFASVALLRDKCRSRRLRRMLEDVHATLNGGGSLSAALARHPSAFGPMLVGVVQVGESTGRLAQALDQVNEIISKEREAKKQAKRAMMYPMAVIGLSLVTLVVLMQVAMPALVEVFDNLGSELPAVTRFAIGSFELISRHKGRMFLGLLLVIGVLTLVRKSERGRQLIHATQIKAPLIGPLVVTAELARFSRSMAMMLQAGITLSSAFHLAILGSKNSLVRKALADAELSLMNGRSLAEALRNHRVMPPVYVELISIGEESNSLERVMSDAAAAYQRRLDQQRAGLLGVLEPASTVVIGSVVAFIAFSMFAPIYQGLNAIR